jgi:RNA polymerase sigma factor (sigma-70 family)
MDTQNAEPKRRFDRIFRPHFDALYRAAWRLTRNREDAEDLVQEVALRALPELERLASLDAPRAWLLRVQYRVFVDGLRRRKAAAIVSGSDFGDADAVSSQDPSPEELAESHLSRRRLALVWHELDRVQRALLALHAEGYTAAELAGFSGLSPNAVTVRLHRARARLARLLKKEPTTDLRLVGMET